MEGFVDYAERLPNLISMLRWSPANLPDCRLRRLPGQNGPDWCSGCEVGPGAAAAGHITAAAGQRDSSSFGLSRPASHRLLWFYLLMLLVPPQAEISCKHQRASRSSVGKSTGPNNTAVTPE